MTTFVETYRPLFVLLTVAVLGWAFYVTYRPRAAGSVGRSRLMSINKVMLWAATGLAIVFLLFPQSVTHLFASDHGFTPDMDRTVITVEGMT